MSITAGPTGEVGDIIYGDGDRPCALRIPKQPPFSAATVPGVPGEAEHDAASRPGAPFPFDLFEAVRFWLTDRGNLALEQQAYDIHDRLLAEASVQERLGVREIPIVNAYLLLLRHWLEQRLGIPAQSRLPQGKKCVIVLSHDVDNPLDPGDPRHEVWLAGLALAKRRRRPFTTQLLNTLIRTRDRMKNSRDRHWVFKEIMRAEDRYGFRSTFFFASTSCVAGHPLDVAYDIRTPRFRSLMRELPENGWEVGLHASYCARESSTTLRLEKTKLEQVAAREVKGTRHHFWHLARPFWSTLQDHEVAGLSYDTSIAFNEQPGYRIGIASTFQPWNPDLQCAIHTVQIPTVAMDGAFFYHPGQTTAAVLSRMQGLLDTLKKYEGIAAIDWHEYTSYPASTRFRVWGETYLELLAMLAADREIHVCNCEQALAMYRRPQQSDLLPI